VPGTSTFCYVHRRQPEEADEPKLPTLTLGRKIRSVLLVNKAHPSARTAQGPGSVARLERQPVLRCNQIVHSEYPSSSMPGLAPGIQGTGQGACRDPWMAGSSPAKTRGCSSRLGLNTRSTPGGPHAYRRRAAAVRALSQPGGDQAEADLCEANPSGARYRCRSP
jgi:hypothetical protein